VGSQRGSSYSRSDFTVLRWAGRSDAGAQGRGRAWRCGSSDYPGFASLGGCARWGLGVIVRVAAWGIRRGIVRGLGDGILDATGDLVCLKLRRRKSLERRRGERDVRWWAKPGPEAGPGLRGGRGRRRAGTRSGPCHGRLSGVQDLFRRPRGRRFGGGLERGPGGAAETSLGGGPAADAPAAPRRGGDRERSTPRQARATAPPGPSEAPPRRERASGPSRAGKRAGGRPPPPSPRADASAARRRHGPDPARPPRPRTRGRGRWSRDGDRRAQGPGRPASPPSGRTPRAARPRSEERAVPATARGRLGPGRPKPRPASEAGFTLAVRADRARCLRGGTMVVVWPGRVLGGRGMEDLGLGGTWGRPWRSPRARTRARTQGPCHCGVS